MDLERIFKEWLKSRPQEEESIFFFAGKPEEGEFILLTWSKPVEREGEEGEDDDDEEEEDEARSQNRYPGTANFVHPVEVAMRLGPSNPDIGDDEEEEDDVMKPQATRERGTNRPKNDFPNIRPPADSIT